VTTKAPVRKYGIKWYDLADYTSKGQVWDMWKRCFGDPDDYMELYFRHKYRPEDTLLCMEGCEGGGVPADAALTASRFTARRYR
jgi:hypothetical protein